MRAPIAQMDRASDYESAGRVFESPWARHLFNNLGHLIKPIQHLFNFFTTKFFIHFLPVLDLPKALQGTLGCFHG